MMNSLGGDLFFVMCLDDPTMGMDMLSLLVIHCNRTRVGLNVQNEGVKDGDNHAGPGCSSDRYLVVASPILD